MERVVLKGSMGKKMASRVSYVVYYIVYRMNLNQLLQIITKLCWSNKDSNNQLQSKFVKCSHLQL